MDNCDRGGGQELCCLGDQNNGLTHTKGQEELMCPKKHLSMDLHWTSNKNSQYKKKWPFSEINRKNQDTLSKSRITLTREFISDLGMLYTKCICISL